MDIEDFYDRDPILRFSVYTAIQIDILRSISKEIGEISDGWIRSEDGGLILEGYNRYYGLFWLWVLGAYEVVRTMKQHSDCFQPALAARIKATEDILSQIRVPFAKQELKKRKDENVVGVTHENSVASINKAHGFGFEIRGVMYYSNDIIEDTFKLFDEVNRVDIISAIRH